MNIRKPWKQTPSYKGEEKAESYNFFDPSSVSIRTGMLWAYCPTRPVPIWVSRIFSCFPTAPPHASGSSICTT